MRCDHVPCGEFVNKSEEDAIEHLKSCLAKLAGQGRWVLLSNLPSAVSERAIPDEIDLVAICGTSRSSIPVPLGFTALP